MSSATLVDRQGHCVSGRVPACACCRPAWPVVPPQAGRDDLHREIWGAMDSRWTDTIRKQLKTVPASKFVAVNESVCLIDRNSRAANCP